MNLGIISDQIDLDLEKAIQIIKIKVTIRLNYIVYLINRLKH